MVEKCRTDMTLNLLVHRASDLEAQIRALQYRNLSPEDFELLCSLEESLKSPTIRKRNNYILTQLPKRKAHECNLETCSICLAGSMGDEDITELPCGHLFHTKCIEPWLTECRNHCPMCNVAIEPPADFNEEQ